MIVIILALLCSVHSAFGMQLKKLPKHRKQKNMCLIYSHGFGEDGVNNASQLFGELGSPIFAPQYPDAPAQLNKACFYTGPAVRVLAQELAERSKEYNAIGLIGRSCGGGTAYSCIKMIEHYPKYKDYFGDTLIQADANRILKALNNGFIIQTVPFLDMKKVNAINKGASMLAKSTVAAASVTTTSFFGPLAGLFTLSFLSASESASHSLQTTSTCMVDKVAMPLITGSNYDASFPKPLELATKEQVNTLTCPILLHFCDNDGVLMNPDVDTVKMYKSVYGLQTHIAITTDGNHNYYGDQFKRVLHAFNATYVRKQTLTQQDRATLHGTQPTVEQLQHRLSPSSDLFSSLSSVSKK